MADTGHAGEFGLVLSAADVDRIIDWFLAAHRNVQGSCGDEANDLVRRLTDYARPKVLTNGGREAVDATQPAPPREHRP